MAYNIGNALLPSTRPALPMSPVGPPQAASPVGAAVLAPPPPVRQPGEGVALPPGLNPMQRILYMLKNDPNARKALMVGGLNLLQSDKEDGAVGNFARATQQGLGTLELARSKEKAEAGAEADRKRAQDNDDRRTKAAEKQAATTTEGTRRDFILAMESAKRATEQDKLTAQHRAAELALREKELAVSRKQSGQATKEDRDFLISLNYVRDTYAREGIKVSPAEEAADALEHSIMLKQRPTAQNNNSIRAAALTTANENAPSGASVEEIGETASGLADSMIGTPSAPLGPLERRRAEKKAQEAAAAAAQQRSLPSPAGGSLLGTPQLNPANFRGF